MDYKKYSIYKAFVYFDEVNDYKIRPVLLLEKDNKYEIFDIYKITHDDRDDNKKKKNVNYSYNYPIRKWKEAGLRVPSLIKIRDIKIIDKKLLIEYIGDLQKEDIIGMEALIKAMKNENFKALEKYNKEFKNKIELSQDVIEQVSKDEYNPYAEALNDTTEVKPVDIEEKYRKYAEEMKKDKDIGSVKGKESSAYENDERENDGR